MGDTICLQASAATAAVESSSRSCRFLLCSRATRGGCAYESLEQHQRQQNLVVRGTRLSLQSTSVSFCLLRWWRWWWSVRTNECTSPRPSRRRRPATAAPPPRARTHVVLAHLLHVARHTTWWCHVHAKRNVKTVATWTAIASYRQRHPSERE